MDLLTYRQRFIDRTTEWWIAFRPYRWIIWTVSAPVGCFVLFIGTCVVLGGTLMLSSTYETHRGAVAGNARDQYMMGMMYYSGGHTLGLVPHDKNKAVYWLHRSALGGDLEAPVFLARIYTSERTPQGNASALYWYQFAADRGSAPAAERLAVIYKNGLLGQKIDPGKAAFWQHKEKALEKAQSETE